MKLNSPAVAPDICSWADMPEELLREVLVRIEASEKEWPMRKTVISCAGVCKSWRCIMKEVVKLPEFTGSLTFPISIKQVYLFLILCVYIVTLFSCL